MLGDLYEFCAARGYRPEGEAILIGAWPTQFVPAFSALTEEAMEQAVTADFDGVPLRVVRADHLAVIALSVGRAKDWTRILSLLESEASAGPTSRVSRPATVWPRRGCRFERRFLDE